MQLAHIGPVPGLPPPQTIRYEDWKEQIAASESTQELLRVVRAYLGAWQSEHLYLLPRELGGSGLLEGEDIVARAVLATRTELKFEGSAIQLA